MDPLLKNLRFLGENLMEEMIRKGTMASFSEGETILREGSYIKVVPLVLEGIMKVYVSNEEKELLLYYITPLESCIMSFSAVLRNEPGKINAVAEAPVQALLLPATEIKNWIRDYPQFNFLFYNQFNTRYSDLIETINHLLFDSLDARLIDFLRRRKDITGENTLRLTHKQIAESLGTAREVITRVLKKLENEGLVKQSHQGIITLDRL